MHDTSEPPDITRLLQEARGDPAAMDRLMRVVFEDLSRMAEAHLKRRFGPGLPGVTLEPAALVNETYLRLLRQRKTYDNRGQFFAIATRVMLRVLVDYQRSRSAARRGGDRNRLTLHLEGRPGPESSGEGPQIEVEALVEALARLEALDGRKADVVKMRVVWSMEMAEIAESLGVSLATVERDWSFAKAWLVRETARPP